MPNWCNNGITITGPKDKIQALYQEIKGKDKFLDVMVPMPTALRDTTSPPYPKDSPHYKPQPTVDGHNNWYDWCIDRWGTKWDMETENFILSEDGTMISGWSDSAWAPPLEAFQTYITKNHDVSIRCSYFEGGCDFAGIWHDGVDESISPSDYKSGDFLDADRDTLLGQLDEDFGVGESMAEYEEDEAEQNRRDEKNDLFAEHSDVAN